jgi:non-haem dioxygenase in morphine synthesis N-terminal
LVIAANLNFLNSAYQGETYNLWEEEYGASFFARSVQLKCCQAVAGNTVGIAVPGWLDAAAAWLQSALGSHWNGQYYQSLIPVPGDKAPYDPNIDIVMAAIYGAAAVTDTKLLATAALLRSQWADPASPYFYQINGADQQRGIGPLLGRYPGDTYDGDNGPQADDHPLGEHPGGPFMSSHVPVIDLAPWFGGDEEARAAVAAEVDGALRSVGFFLISGHGVADELRSQVRAQARAFFALPPEVKQHYAVTVGGRGWLPPGVEGNAYAEGTVTPPDMKKSFAAGVGRTSTRRWCPRSSSRNGWTRSRSASGWVGGPRVSRAGRG